MSTTERMSDERLAEIRARCDSAAPPPWVVEDLKRVVAPCPCCGPICECVQFGASDVAECYHSEFIAHARDDVPDLLREVERARAEIAVLRSNRCAACASEMRYGDGLWVCPVCNLRAKVAALEASSQYCAWKLLTDKVAALEAENLTLATNLQAIETDFLCRCPKCDGVGGACDLCCNGSARYDDAYEFVKAENKALRAIVDRLLKTADGVVITPNLEVWCVFRTGIVHGRATGAGDSKRIWVRYDEPIDLSDGCGIMADKSDPVVSVVFSTREAAEAAKMPPYPEIDGSYVPNEEKEKP